MPAHSLLILKICAVIIVIGMAILAFDKYYVRRDEPSKEQRVDELSERLELNDRSSDQTAQEHLMAVLGRFEEISGSVQEVDTILNRNDDETRLWLAEFDSRRLALYRGAGQTSRINVPLLAIMIEFKGRASLPLWIQPERLDSDAEIAPPLNAEALARLQRMDDFRMAMSGNQVLFVSQLEAPALVQAINQRTSSEFHAGLLNSALQIDVQRAIDIVNLLDTELPQVARFYKIDVPPVDIDIPDRPISAGLDEIRDQTHAKIEEQRKQWEQQRAEQQAQWDAQREALRQERERKAAERKAESEARMAALRAKMEASRAELRDRRSSADGDAEGQD